MALNLAPMIDVTFLLLIFFLVTTIFALEQGIPLVLPGKESHTAKISRKNILEVNAYPNGAVIIEEKHVPLSSLRALVEQRLALNEKLVVVIQTHPDAEYGLMVDILDELKLANARRIALKTMKGG